MENTTHRDANQKVEGDGGNPKRKEKESKVKVWILRFLIF
jgi:hypothetical protein